MSQYRLLLIPQSIVTTIIVILLVFLLVFTCVGRGTPLSLMRVSAKSSHKLLANYIPTKDLCVTCTADKNIIRGKGLIVGTDHSDYIIGSDELLTENDIVFAKDGNDVVFTGLGIDTIYGSNGDDTIQAGPGNDQLMGQDGNDNLFGGFDDDLLVGGPGNDHLFGDVGNDVLVGGSGANYFDCGDGIDTVLDFNPSQGDVMAGNCELF